MSSNWENLFNKDGLPALMFTTEKKREPFTICLPVARPCLRCNLVRRSDRRTAMD